jgi:hypothetical protein
MGAAIGVHADLEVGAELAPARHADVRLEGQVRLVLARHLAVGDGGGAGGDVVDVDLEPDAGRGRGVGVVDLDLEAILGACARRRQQHGDEQRQRAQPRSPPAPRAPWHSARGGSAGIFQGVERARAGCHGGPARS